MRNPFRSALNFAVAAVAALALAPVVVAPAPAYARGGGGGSPGGKGGGSGGGSKAGGGKTTAGKNGSKGGNTGPNGQIKDTDIYLIQMQEQQADDGRAGFQFQARDDATMNGRDKDRAAALLANHEAESQSLRADDMPRP